MKLQRTLFTGYIPPLAWMTLLFVLSSIPGPTADRTGWLSWVTPPIQNLLHVPIYAVLSLLWLNALTKKTIATGQHYVMAIAISMAWATFEETYQTLIPGRYGSVSDLVLDVLGVLTGALVFYWGQRRRA